MGIALRLEAASPRFRARITGAVYLLYFVTALLGEVFLRQAGVSGMGGVSGDAAATASSLLAHESAFQTGFALSLISAVFYVALTALLYRLFSAVSQSLSLVAAFVSLVAIAVQLVGSVFQLAPLVVLSGSPYLSAFTPQQAQALALMSLHLSAQVGGIYLVLFGVFLLVTGYLIYASAFLPRPLGVLVALAGCGWLTYLSPSLASSLALPVEVLGFLAEVGFMLWLLVVGVKPVRERRPDDSAAVVSHS